MRLLISEYDKDERSLLLFLETRLVDYQGRVASVHMNAEDFEIVKKWVAEGLISFGRLTFDVVEASKGKPLTLRHTHWVRFSETAWELAHIERKARSERMLTRDYQKLENEKTSNRE